MILSGLLLAMLALATGEEMRDREISKEKEESSGEPVITETVIVKDLASRQRNLNNVFDEYSDVSPEDLFVDYNPFENQTKWLEVDTDSFDLENDTLQGDEWKELRREERKDRVSEPRAKVETNVQSFFNLFPINERGITDMVRNILGFSTTTTTTTTTSTSTSTSTTTTTTTTTTTYIIYIIYIIIYIMYMFVYVSHSKSSPDMKCYCRHNCAPGPGVKF